LKRRFTQKVKQVPSCAADSFDALLKLSIGKQQVGAAIPTEVNRRARTSAAMIGLAISMGTASVLLPQQSDEAMAVEPIATEPNSPIVPSAPSASVSSAPIGEKTVVAIATPPSSEKTRAAVEKPTLPPVVEHNVQEGETLWALSKTYEVQPEAIAASNNIQPSAVLPVGQRLKIPSVNGIVHEVKAGETVKGLSKSYGVEPTQWQASLPVSESSQLQNGETITVPGNVNDLLKARQDVALNNLKEQRNRLNDSLAELRSEESTNLSDEAAVPTETASATESITPVTLPPAVLKPQKLVANAPQPVASVPTNAAVIPVPTPEMAATPRVDLKASTQLQSPVVIPVPTPEMAATPRVDLKASTQLQSPVVIPVPTPEMAATPRVEPKASTQRHSPVALPVPTPQIAATPRFEPKAATLPNIGTSSVTPTTAVQPQVPHPVVMQPLVAATNANLYKVKPGDTLEAIARRHGLSRSELIQANGLNNPNLLSVDQQLRIPKGESASAAAETVTLLPGIDTKSSGSTSEQEQRGVAIPTLAVSTVSDSTTSAAPTAQRSQGQSTPRAVLAQSTVVADAKPDSSVVANTQPNQSANSKDNPYIDRLRADILKLREEYQNRKESDQAVAPRSIAVPTVPAPATSSSNNASIPVRVNPEFKPNQNDTLQADRGRQRQQPQVLRGAIKIEVPPPATTGLSRGQQDLVATAPGPVDSYNPAIRTPVGQTVSPELPSLSAPDMYLPDSPTQFNGYIWPAKGVLTSGYGMRWGRMHRGIDIAAPIGTPVVAVAPGVVVSAGWNEGGYGNLVEIQHPDGSVTLYAHNNRILVRRGQEVAQGQQISEMGSTGRSTGPHCHFEVHPNGRGAVNPIAFLPRK
jgi:murein DD-endopeptidase MepM/ murein hydrolase activator NlpD